MLISSFIFLHVLVRRFDEERPVVVANLPGVPVRAVSRTVGVAAASRR